MKGEKGCHLVYVCSSGFYVIGKLRKSPGACRAKKANKEKPELISKRK